MLTRRQASKLLFFSALTRPYLPRESKSKPTVIILGAGLAGLTAAYELQRVGYDPVVLEASNRVGGRVWTMRGGFSDDMHAELGATIIPNNHDLTLKYVRMFGLELVPALGRGTAELYYVKGKRFVPSANLTWPPGLTAEEQRLGVVGMMQKYIGPAIQLIGDPDNPTWPTAEAGKFDKVTIVDVLRSNGASAAAIGLLRMGYFDLWGDGADACSALMFLRDLARKRTEQNMFAIKGGNDLLPRAFASHLEKNVELETQVKGISQTAERVRVEVSRNDVDGSVVGDFVVCTLPFSVLRGIRFTPTLSPVKQHVIDNMLYTSITRVYLQMRTRFWLKDGIPGNANTDLACMYIQDASQTQQSTRGILEAYTAGANARSFCALPTLQRGTKILENVKRVYPHAEQNFEKAFSKCWDEDPNFRGDFSWFGPGQLLTFQSEAARPEGRIFFAGEHTSSYPGWMQGAIESGLRVVKAMAGNNG